MIEVAYTNTQSKMKINGLLSDFFTLISDVWQGFSLVYCYTLLRLSCGFINADRRIKGVQIGDHETKQ